MIKGEIFAVDQKANLSEKQQCQHGSFCLEFCKNFTKPKGINISKLCCPKTQPHKNPKQQTLKKLHSC